MSVTKREAAHSQPVRNLTELILHCLDKFGAVKCTMVVPILDQRHAEETSACKHCGGTTKLMGTLPAMVLKPPIKVFRCLSCNCISWTEH